MKNKKGSYSWLLFDADGTLFAYDRAEEKALQNVFAEYQIPFDREINALYQHINHRLWKLLEEGRITLEKLRSQRFANLFQELNIETDPEKFSRDYLIFLGKEADLIPGAWTVLQQLQPHFHMAIITNGITSVQRSRLKVSGLDSFFEHLFISEEIGHFKPAHEFFDYVHETIGKPARKKILVIGDSLSSDIAGGAGFGVDTCWYNPAGKPAAEDLQPTFVIKALEELLQLLPDA